MSNHQAMVIVVTSSVNVIPRRGFNFRIAEGYRVIYNECRLGSIKLGTQRIIAAHKLTEDLYLHEIE